MRLLILLVSCLLFIASCVKDKPQDAINTAISINSANSVLIVNEGNYGWGNASISLYNPSSNAIVTDYYKQQNSGSTIGDVCQSITKFNNNYYIVMNNSNKILVVNASDFKKTATISGFNSPRYMLPITFNKAYVSDIYQNSIQIIDLNSNSIVGSISCMAGTEEMALIYNMAFVTNPKSNYCYVINTVTNSITDSLFIGKNASGISIDKNSKIWILSKGDVPSSQALKLICINPITVSIEKSISFAGGQTPWRLCINKTKDTLFYLNNGVYNFPISQSSLSSSPIISQGSKLYYGLGYNPNDNTIYVSDAIDYVQKSKIEIYTPDGTFIKSVNAGIISNSFIFD